MTNGIESAQTWAREWLFDQAFPIWLNKGWDADGGGFHDKLDQAGDPVDIPKRIRVQARQIFVYVEAGKLGWDGRWREPVEQGLDFMLDAYEREDGLYRMSVANKPGAGSDSADLYDQAFVIFALSAAQRAMPESPVPLKKAEALLTLLEERYAHPLGGFRETDGSAGLRSNPHMHMLEALLAWVELGQEGLFKRKAQQIVGIAISRFLDPVTGAVGEYFDDDWAFAAGEQGQIREPGHQFEWAYLLGLAGELLGGDHSAPMARLYDFGSRFGLVDDRAIFSIDAQGRPIDTSSRLWAQTERLRTALIFARSATGDARTQYHKQALEAFDCLRKFLDVPVGGLWMDRVDAEGRYLKDEPAPASSFYHIMTGLLPLLAAPNS